MADFVSVQFLLHMFSNSEEIELELLLTSLLVLYRMYPNGLMVSMVPTGVRKILTYMMFWAFKIFLPHFQLWQEDVKKETGISTAKLWHLN